MRFGQLSQDLFSIRFRQRCWHGNAGEEFSAVFTNWTVSDPQNRRTLDLLADGTFPGAPDSWLRSSPGPREPS